MDGTHSLSAAAGEEDVLDDRVEGAQPHQDLCRGAAAREPAEPLLDEVDSAGRKLFPSVLLDAQGLLVQPIDLAEVEV